MIIQFHIHFKTNPGEVIALLYKGEKGQEQTVHMQSYDGENWILSLDSEFSSLTYNYLLIAGQKQNREWGQPRKLIFTGKAHKYYYVNDFWRSRENVHHAFLSSAFVEAIHKRKNNTTLSGKKQSVPSGTNILEMNIEATLPENLCLGVIGNTEGLGKWLKPIIMEEAGYPNWRVSIPIETYDISVQYKYVTIDQKSGEITEWEIGDNRVFKRFFPEVDKYKCIVQDEDFRFGTLWRGAGVAIPIFSIRSKKGMGIGEFSDLIPMVEWASQVGLKMIQVLPVNDTIANKTWQDSYPYAAISVFALHPLYVNIEKIGAFKEVATAKTYLEDKKMLNKSDQIDFVQVMEKKLTYLSILYEERKEVFAKDPAVSAFRANNYSWLMSYAAFCVLRDLHGTCQYDKWKELAVYNVAAIEKKYKEEKAFQDKVDFYIFIQYHAHLQMTEARNFARSNGIALKGDLPIGIYRHSCDAWVAPHLYNMDEQAGAPPDDFSELGQNWGFPTYNWEEMARDDFSWWKARFRKLNEYFDALRIDHILGFFRIWQIPTRHVSGTMGLFNPRLPFSKEEIIRSGLTGEIKRYTKPFLTEELLLHHFSDMPACIKTFFDKKQEGLFVFKKVFSDQKSLSSFIKEHDEFLPKQPILLKLFTEIILIEESSGGEVYYNPRITVNTTYSYQCLDEGQKKIVLQLYNDYYFKRHDTYWKSQALWKLPALLDASNMLICGEDLGMIPNSVPEVMRAMNILSLEIQRMPKGNQHFGIVQNYPYFSVASPSCHDMSTIRGWWENDHEMAKEYYYQYMSGHGYTPMKCEARIVQYIVEDHLAGPSMLAIFPLQDLVGLDADLRRMDAFAEQINEPSNPNHYWQFRFHMNIEDLLEEDAFTQRLLHLISKYRP